MKILMLTDGMDRGGAETHIAMLSEGLIAGGVSVSVLSEGGRIADALEERGIPQYRLPHIGRDPLALLRARHFLRELYRRERFDLLHAHARIPALLLRGGGWSATPPRRLVTAHAAYSPVGAWARLSYWGDRTLAVSEDLRALLCDGFHVPPEQVEVIPNGIDCTRFSPPVTPPPPQTVLFASRLDRDCSLGAELLLELAVPLKRVFPRLTVTVAGGGSEWEYLAWRGSRIEGETGERFLRFTGDVTEMDTLYRAHRIFVGVSRAAMEAAASGCAVILCGNEGFGGYLDPASPLPALSNFCCRGLDSPTARRLASYLAPLLAHPVLAARLAKEGTQKIRADFSANAVVKAYLAFLNTLP